MKKITQNPSVVLGFRVAVIVINIIIMTTTMSTIALRNGSETSSTPDFLGAGISMLALVAAFVPLKRSNVAAVIITIISIAFRICKVIGVF
jgi:hypothetical protein